MKLSEILKDWPVKEVNEYYGDYGIRNEGFNDALISCDREIDREALASKIKSFCVNDLKIDISSYGADKLSTHIISTMPQWLKGVKNEAK